MLGFQPEPGALETCCPTHCAVWTFGNSEKCQWHRNNEFQDRNSNPDLLFEKILSQPIITFRNKKSWQNTLRKKRKMTLVNE